MSKSALLMAIWDLFIQKKMKIRYHTAEFKLLDFKLLEFKLLEFKLLVLLQPTCMEADFFEEVSIFVVWLSVASLPSPSSNIEAWPYGTSLRFASLLHLGHYGYESIADYVTIIISTKSDTRFQLSEFNSI